MPDLDRPASGAALTSDESAAFAAHEQVIEAGLRTFIDVGKALIAIRGGRLYRADYATFEDYCEQRWNFTDRHGRRLMAAAQVAEVAGPMGPLLLSERAARELAPMLDRPDALRAVLAQAVEETNGKPTAEAIRAAFTAWARAEAPPVSVRVDPSQATCGSAPTDDEQAAHLALPQWRRSEALQFINQTLRIAREISPVNMIAHDVLDALRANDSEWISEAQDAASRLLYLANRLVGAVSNRDEARRFASSNEGFDDGARVFAPQ